MKLPDLNQLDFSDVGGWPLPTKIAVIAIVCVVSLAAKLGPEDRAFLSSDSNRKAWVGSCGV